MNWNWKLMASLLTAAVFALPGSAIAGQPPGNEIDQELDELDIDIDVDDMVENDADIYVGDYDDGHANAVANCQWLLAVNSIVHTNVEVDMLGVISDDDLSEYPWWRDLIGIARIFPGGDVTQTEQVTKVANGSATCAQDIGHVTVHLASFEGWGDPAPMAGALSTAAITPSWKGGGGPPSRNMIDQDADIDIEVDVDDLVVNDVYIEVDGDANSVTNCQLLIAWNTFIVNDVRFSAEGRISDDDQDSVVMPPRNGGDPPMTELRPTVGNGMLPGGDVTLTQTFDASRTSSANCSQTVQSITLSTGDELVRVPPES